MASTIISNLYPPIIATWMPSFYRKQSCKVYFSLSAYNSLKDIAEDSNYAVQVMVSNQNSSLSALEPLQFPSGIGLCSLKEDPDVKGDAKYYITIDPSYLRGGEFEIGQYYKVQLRFTGAGCEPPPNGGNKDEEGSDTAKEIAQWLQNNTGYFSEWSTVCLIHGIEYPHIYLREFPEDEQEDLILLNTTSLTLTGQLGYEENAELESEYLQYYNVDLYNAESNELVYSSGDVYTNEYYPNEINYVLKYNLDISVAYRLEFSFTTNGEYTRTETWNFLVYTYYIEYMDATITATPDEKNGRMQVEVAGKDSSVFLGNICIRRTSNETDFTVWEDIHITALTEEKPLDYIWYDYTVKAGVFYRYCVLKIDADGSRGGSVKTRTPVMLSMDDMFLTRADMQVCLRFDPGVSSYKVTLSESKTDTIGSRYPHFMRNGNIAYKQFPITGLIVSYCDEDHLFSSPKEFYGADMLDYYEDFNSTYQIPEYEDFIYERNFREKVMKFLYDDNVKLFRSLTEGNILVKLMDISFTPNQTLGRMLYSFSATAYEVDECSIDNYINYGILEMGNYSENFDIEYNEEKVGQIADTFAAGENIVSRIKSHFENVALDGFVNTITSITCLKIDFQSDPYLIICGSDGSLKAATASDKYSDDMVYGYIVNINGVDILVSSRGYYIADSDVVITSISFPVETEANIDFKVDIEGHAKTNEGGETVLRETFFYTRIGQLFGVFDVEDSITYQIYLRYYLDYEDYFQKILSIDEVTIEADPGTVIYLKDSFDDDFYRHIVGKTRILRLYDEETVISAMYFGGIHLEPMVDETRLVPNIDEYRDMQITVDDVSEIETPYEHGVYVINNGITTTRLSANARTENGEIETYNNMIKELAAASNRYIYWHGDWYTITEDNDVLCPVEAIVDYVYELERGYYE